LPDTNTFQTQKNNGGNTMQRIQIPRKAKPTEDIPAADLNAWGYPDANKWSFVGYGNTMGDKDLAWWVKA